MILHLALIAIVLGFGFYVGFLYGPAVAAKLQGWRDEADYLRNRAWEIEQKIKKAL